ncbi:MAG: 2,3-bisphosphoglycerate-independent phosphoglycerate mutase [Gammaproteobacteria bacterium]|nr:2,3-bisphosphoglycerate-independent phosphoglycerate mutase [Gammaproteobacteria bacterium]
MTKISPHVLIVLDGWGHREDREANAIALANTPTWDQLWQHAPHCLISGSGTDVGLPDGQMGNSEVGHMSLGGGRVVAQDFTRISKAIADNSFFTNPVLTSTFKQLAGNGKSLHLFGLLSPGGVHSHEDHIRAAVKMAFDNGVITVFMHAFLDGRDVPPKSALASLLHIDEFIRQNGRGGIASSVGRYYAMDRDNRWERVEPAYYLVTHGISDYTAESPEEALHEAYRRGESDEFVKPTTIAVSGQSVAMSDGDAVVFMNFRADRAREITRAFTDDDFPEFNRNNPPQLASFITLTKYSEDIDAPFVFAPRCLKNSLGEVLSDIGMSQLRLAETEKYAHVTFFFSGGREAPFANEDRVLIPSPKVATYDLQPSMSAPEVTDELVKAIESGKYNLIICNYANGDMLGHTGNLLASIEAVECLDQCLARVIAALKSCDGHCLITADHGNVEQMKDESTGQAHTAHTTELVPLIYVGSKKVTLTNSGGTLSDVAPTLLTLMDIRQPEEMTGNSLACLEPG